MLFLFVQKDHSEATKLLILVQHVRVTLFKSGASHTHCDDCDVTIMLPNTAFGIIIYCKVASISSGIMHDVTNIQDRKASPFTLNVHDKRNQC